MKKLLQSLFILLLVATSALAQDRTVTGTVTAKEDGLPLPGVSVKVKGTTSGAQTAADGKFSIKVSGNTATLVFTYVGYGTQEVSVGTREVVNISLSTDSKLLGEVVVVAYGTAKKEAITGSIASLSATDLESRVTTNISNVFAGIAPGVQATASNGQPGTSSSIRIRGFGSYSASSSPLYVLDGAVYDGNIGDINPNDIESVSLLKDASSSALYGARAGNGVIIITTKKGKLGEPKFNVSLNQGFSQRGIPEYDRVGAMNYHEAYWKAIYHNRVYPASGTADLPAAAATYASANVGTQLVYNPFNIPTAQLVGTNGKLNPGASLLYNDFDWASYMQRTGKRTDLNSSLSGNNGKSDYFVSFGYLNDEGWVMKSDFERFSGRVNVNSQVKSWLKTGLNLTGTMSTGNNAYDAASGNASSFINPFQFTRGMGAIYPVRAYDANGNPVMDAASGQQWFDFGQHPGAVNRPGGASAGRHVVYETMLNDNIARRNALNARGYVEIKFLKDFTFKTNISTDLRNAFSTVFWNKTVGDGVTYAGYGSKASSFNRSYTFNQMLNYDKTFGKHTVSVLAAHENYDFESRTLDASKQGLILAGNTEFPNFVTPRSAGGAADMYKIESYFSRATYNYDDKYFLEGSVRRDASSRFAPESRWGTFYSTGASWVISKENFMQNVEWVNDLKAKVSYGEVGNDGLSSYYAYQAFYDLGWNNGAEPGILLSSASNPALQWESSNTLNAGVSFSLFNRRLTGEVEYFKRGSSNLLFSVPLPISGPVTSINQNIGAMYNKGLEVQLGGDIIRKQDFSWNILTNWTFLKNRITELPASNPVITSGTKRREVGKDLYSYWLRQWGGVDPADGAALYVFDSSLTPTDIRVLNNVAYTTNPSYAKYDYSGTAIPDLTGSVSNTFNYKNLSLSFLINYQIGGKFYDGEYAGLMGIATYGKALHKDVLNSWTTPGQITNIPRLDVGRSSFFNTTSNRWLIDASYVSFQNVSMAYKLPKSILSKLDIGSARVFIAGENLGMISKRKGMNPTEAYDGVNSTTYTPSRTISFGLNVTL